MFFIESVPNYIKDSAGITGLQITLDNHQTKTKVFPTLAQNKKTTQLMPTDSYLYLAAPAAAPAAVERGFN